MVMKKRSMVDTAPTERIYKAEMPGWKRSGQSRSEGSFGTEMLNGRETAVSVSGHFPLQKQTVQLLAEDSGDRGRKKVVPRK